MAREVKPVRIPRFHPWPGSHPWHDHQDGHFDEESFFRKAEPLPKAPKPSHENYNDQAAGVGVSTYHDIASHYGTLSPGTKTDLNHYNYAPHEHKIDSLIAEQGYKTHIAGGKFGKFDLKNKNYSTKDLVIYDPTPSSGGDFQDEGTTRSWRKIHELGHALTYGDINAKYGEGKRLGKLGQRSIREAKRAVEWEWHVAHKQRELSEKIGVKIPDEQFHKELNTVMHDAVHRAIHGKFTEPSDEGFRPHPHKVPLHHAMNLIDEHAKKLGMHEDIPNQHQNIESQIRKCEELQEKLRKLGKNKEADLLAKAFDKCLRKDDGTDEKGNPNLKDAEPKTVFLNPLKEPKSKSSSYGIQSKNNKKQKAVKNRKILERAEKALSDLRKNIAQKKEYSNIINHEKHDHPFNLSSDHKDLVHGLDLDSRSPVQKMGVTLDTSFANNIHTGKQAVVKSHNAFMEGISEQARKHNIPPLHKRWSDLSTSKREILYHNLANNVFGAKGFVPSTAGFHHGGTEYSAQERVPGISLKSPIPDLPTQRPGDSPQNRIDEIKEHTKTNIAFPEGYKETLEHIHSKGQLHHIGMMNAIMGNNDRKRDNFLVDPKEKRLHLIDNSAAFDFHGQIGGVDTPHYILHHQRITGDDTERLHPIAHKMLNSIDASHLSSVLSQHGIGADHFVHKNMQARLKSAKTAASEGLPYNDILSRIKATPVEE